MSTSANKRCSACNFTKARGEFHVRRASADGLAPCCKACTSKKKKLAHVADPQKSIDRVAAWRLANPNGRKSERVHDRKNNLKKLYGMSLEEHDAILATQGGVCAICKGPPTGRGAKNGSFHVDHDHVTGRTRGLLCHGCNVGIGSLRDSPDLLRAAVVYLESRSLEPVG